MAAAPEREEAPGPRPRPALDLTVSSGNTTISLKIDDPPLARHALTGIGIGCGVAAGIGIGCGVALAVLFYRQPELVTSAVTQALEGPGLQVGNIAPGSILVELYCKTKESFLSFMKDFRNGKVKQRLKEEFAIIGYKEELEVTISNFKEVNKKLHQIRVRPPPPAAETSSYHTNVRGGNTSIGDQSVLYVGTVIPRTASTAGTIEEPPVFPQQPANREGISSGNPTESENSSDTPGSLSYAVPEGGSAASSADKVIATGSSKALSYLVPERNNPGIPTENASDTDAPGELPYSVPEESRSPKAEVPVNSLSSSRNDVLVRDAGRGDSTNCRGAVTETCGPTKGTETRETVTDTPNITPTSTAESVSSSSSERVAAPSEAAAVGTTSGGKAACELKRSSASPGNNENVQAVGSSVDVGAHKLSAVDVPPSKNNAGWGSALQKNRKSKNSKRAGPVSRGLPKDLSKRLLQMSSSPADDTTVGDILQGPRPDLDPASETDLHLHCREWDNLLNSGEWEPEQIIARLPKFFQFVKDVQGFVLREMKTKTER